MMSLHSSANRLILCLFVLLAVSTLSQSAYAPNVANIEQLAPRSLPPSVTTADPRKPTPETCEQQQEDSCVEGTGMGQDHEPAGAEYKPNVFKLAPKKEAKVKQQRKKEAAPDSPADGVGNCSPHQTPCYGECCDNHNQHCAWMQGLHKYSTAWSTCCPKGKHADKEGACCRPGKIGKDNKCY